MISVSVLGARRAVGPADLDDPATLAPLPEERRRKLAPADALAIGNALRLAREAGGGEPPSDPRRLAILLVADAIPRVARRAFLEGPPPPGLASPTFFLHTSANFAAAQVAIALGSRGPSATFAGEEDALERAVLWLATGAAQEALVFAGFPPPSSEALAVLLARDRGRRGPLLVLRGRPGGRPSPPRRGALRLLVEPPASPPEGIAIGDRLWLLPSR